MVDQQVRQIAAFLTARANDPEISGVDRMRIQGILSAYRAGRAPVEAATAVRAMAARFGDHPDYRSEWRPSAPDQQRRADTMDTVVGLREYRRHRSSRRI